VELEAVLSVITALSLTTGTDWSACQVVRLVETQTVAVAAPGAVNPNCTMPFVSTTIEPGLKVGGSTMLNGRALTPNTAELVALEILIE
jgi:hypothetical protein